MKKLPKAVLSRCEWGKDDYSLKVKNLPKAPPPKGQMELLSVSRRDAERTEGRYDNHGGIWQNGNEWRTVMSEITLSIPDETLVALKVKPDQLGAEIRFGGCREAV